MYEEHHKMASMYYYVCVQLVELNIVCVDFFCTIKSDWCHKVMGTKTERRVEKYVNVGKKNFIHFT